MTVHLTLEDLLILVDDLEVGPARDLGLLESAVLRPATSLWGRDAYPSLDAKAAAVLDSIVRNHALVDGNKRLGWLATAVFLEINDASVAGATDDEVFDLVWTIASARSTIEEIAHHLEMMGRRRS